MYAHIKRFATMLPLVFGGVLLLSFSLNGPEVTPFPYEKAGLTEREAAAHLLDRFTYGASPGQVDEVVQMGLEAWFAQQLKGQLPDAALKERLKGYSTLSMSNEEIVRTFPKPGQVLRLAIRDGVVEKDQVSKDQKEKIRPVLEAYMQEQGYKPQREVYRELAGQKILRAAYSQNQLQEVLTGFWFNHFNVSLTDNDCARFILTYERDAIRPHVLGKFESLLLATAQSPAMLTYLDNFKSGVPTVSREKLKRRQMKQRAGDKNFAMAERPQNNKPKEARGLNENYAREVMELHTLGVDGGYTQRDVTEAARIFTGWTINPALNAYGKSKPQSNRASANFSRNGFVRNGDFFFAANRHDNEEKMVLGTRFPVNGGYEEGVKLISMLAQHPSTARFICSKLAVRFVSDTPPKALVDRMAKTFRKTGGDIKEVLLTMVSAPEFWSREAIREKIKSPFELAVSALRSLDAEVTNPYPLYGWITRMGEKMYAYQAPTGFPDNGQYWINTGSLLARMNFGLALASRRIPGLKIDLPRLHKNREPESAEQALVIYSQYLMPERDLEETVKRLSPALSDPAFSDKVDRAAHKAAPREDELMVKQHQGLDKDVLAQVVGIVIGSPEFQRK